MKNMFTECAKKARFERICKMTQKGVKKFATSELKKTHNKIIVDDGFVYAQGDIPVLLVAHMDTVHKELPNTIVYKNNKDKMSSPNGIGGDDRCGIYMALEVVKKYNCSVLFCEDEEIGGVGAEKFADFVNAMIDAADKGNQTETIDIVNEMEFNYMIEFDRRGKNDAVFYDCDNDKFTKFICQDFFKVAYGSFSDISILAPFFGVAAVNLSCGYYNAHTKDEYVLFSEMERVILEACKILERTTEEDVFEYVPYKYKGSYGKGYSGYDYTYGTAYGGGWYDDDDYYYYNNGWDFESFNGKVKEVQNLTYYYLIEYKNEKGVVMDYEVTASSKEEAVGMFCMDHPTLTYNHILTILDDSEPYM